MFDQSEPPAFKRRSVDEVETKVTERLNLDLTPASNEITRAREHARSFYEADRVKAQAHTENLVRLLGTGKYGGESAGLLSGIAMQEGGAMLASLSQDFQKNDWEYADKLAGLMDKVPGLRAQIRESILEDEARQEAGYYKSYEDTFDRRLKLTSLMLADQQKNYGEDMKNYFKAVAVDTAREAYRLREYSTRAGINQRWRTIYQRDLALGIQAENLKLAGRRVTLAELKEAAGQGDKEAKRNLARINSSRQWTSTLGYRADWQGKPILKDGQVQPTRAAGGGAGLTPNERTSTVRSATSTIRDIASEHLGASIDSPTARKDRMKAAKGQDAAATWRRAMTEAMGAVAPTLQAAGYTPKQIRNIVAQTLRSKGLRPKSSGR